MRCPSTLGVVAAAAIALAVGPARGQPASDQQFLEYAARAGQAEIELGQLAAQRAGQDAVRQLAERLVTDHVAAARQLIALAQRHGLAPASALTDEQRNIRDRISALREPSAFDRAYVQEMLVDHQKDADEFEREAQSGRDPETSEWAAVMLPTIRQHLDLARAIHTVIVLGPPPPPAPSASVPTTMTPAPSRWCGGAYAPPAGTNFGSCPTR